MERRDYMDKLAHVVATRIEECLDYISMVLREDYSLTIVARHVNPNANADIIAGDDDLADIAHCIMRNMSVQAISNDPNQPTACEACGELVVGTHLINGHKVCFRCSEIGNLHFLQGERDGLFDKILESLGKIKCLDCGGSMTTDGGKEEPYCVRCFNNGPPDGKVRCECGTVKWKDDNGQHHCFKCEHDNGIKVINLHTNEAGCDCADREVPDGAKDNPNCWMQVVELHLEDGRVGIFAGPPLIWGPEDAEGALAKDTHFHRPEPMPYGTMWSVSKKHDDEKQYPCITVGCQGTMVMMTKPPNIGRYQCPTCLAIANGDWLEERFRKEGP